MDNLDNKKLLKVVYHCKHCKYKSSNMTNYHKHLKTNKHTNNMDNEMDNKKMQKVASEYKCKCGKKYKFMSGLCKHKKKCDYKDDIIENNESKTSDLVIENNESEIFTPLKI